MNGISLKYLCSRLYVKVSLLEFPARKTFTPIFLASDLANMTYQQTTFCYRYKLDPRQPREDTLSFAYTHLTRNWACGEHGISWISLWEKY